MLTSINPMRNIGFSSDKPITQLKRLYTYDINGKIIRGPIGSEANLRKKLMDTSSVVDQLLPNERHVILPTDATEDEVRRAFDEQDQERVCLLVGKPDKDQVDEMMRAIVRGPQTEEEAKEIERIANLPEEELRKEAWEDEKKPKATLRVVKKLDTEA